jgi:hypothetical protein
MESNIKYTEFSLKIYIRSNVTVGVTNDEACAYLSYRSALNEESRIHRCCVCNDGGIGCHQDNVKGRH